MTRAATLILGLAAVGAAYAAEITDTLPARCDAFVYTLRLKAARTQACDARITFGNGAALTFQVPALADAADGRPHPVSYRFTDPSGACVARGKAPVTIDPAEKGFGLRLRANAAGLAIALGGPCEEMSASVAAFDTPAARSVTATIPGALTVMRRSLRAEALAPPQAAPFASVEALAARLAASSDPREGLYKYLDKDIATDGPAAMSRPEGYVLAIVRDPADEDSYLIIHLKSTAASWKPLEIKARMTPTPFTGHFDLRWTSATRRPLSEADTYAQYNENASILTLAFPSLRASFRLARVLPEKQEP